MAGGDERERQKVEAARRSLAFVESGMAVGLGSGTTAAHVIRQLGAAVRNGLVVRAIPSSEATATAARREGIPLIGFEDVQELDVTIDGADEVDPRGDMIKGGGGAMLRERLLAAAARRLVIVVDGDKRVAQLGAFGVPVEVVPFGAAYVERRLARLGLAPRLRRVEGRPALTDQGNVVIDCAPGVLADAGALASVLDALPGVVDHGLFLGFAPTVVSGADADGAAPTI